MIYHSDYKKFELFESLILKNFVIFHLPANIQINGA